jgi:hypothetical protein
MKVLFLFTTLLFINTDKEKEGDIQFTKSYEFVKNYASNDSNLMKCQNSNLTKKIIVSPQQIPFSLVDVTCNFIQKKYKKEAMSCSQVNMKEGRLIQIASDSVYKVTSTVKPIPFNQSIMYEKAREPEIGYVMMFSDVYKNCVMVELRYFCNDSTGNPWGKKAMVFFFEFDAKNEIKMVYQNEKMYR